MAEVDGSVPGASHGAGPSSGSSGSAGSPVPDLTVTDLSPTRRGERVTALLTAFERLTGTRVRITVKGAGERRVLFNGLGPDSEGDPGEVIRSEEWPISDTQRAMVEYEAGDGDEALRFGELLRESLAPLLSSESELDFFASELEARLEEVELLTSVGETLGSVVGVERAAGRLLRATAAVLDAEEAEVWVADPDGIGLSRIAREVRAVKPVPDGPDRIPAADSDSSPLGRAYREGRAESGVDRRAGGEADTPWLLVPLRHTALHGTAGAIGVLKLRGVPGRNPFRAREERVASAVASHLAAALENRRLLDDSVERERMLVELALAHDLQLKLLPETGDFEDLADIAARCDPAESVGGDFYHILRLPGDRLGVMLGDVSSHGYSAGLIMALTMSAASLVAREHDDPAAALSGIHRELVRKLESTEMYMTVCYAVLDPVARSLRYANAGHPHAWRIREDETVRLEALNPPLGIAEFDRYGSREVEWRSGADTLLMFTDGLSDCLRTGRMWSDELLTDVVSKATAASSDQVLDSLFDLAAEPDGGAVDDRTALVVK
ncbi:MAG: SpoIIE family protein phosphatase [marine benthic group bacterium]|nr:SpoIIE family protein phosphatase [Gemmatimonadota bacterium]